MSAATSATTLTALMESNRRIAKQISHHAGEREQRDVGFDELYERALGILYRLQQLGARPGDKLILLLSANEPFIDAFWAGVLGSIIPVPVAVGISDEHRHKLLRIARKLGTPYIYTERRLLERIGSHAASCGETATFAALAGRAFLVDDLDAITRSGKLQRARPEDPAFIQFSSGSTSEPKGVVLTHANLMANIRGASQAANLDEHDISLSWMPLTHDMGLIGFHLTMFANRIHSHFMQTELFVRRPLLWLTLAARVRASLLGSPNFGYRHYLKVLADRSPGDIDLSCVRLLFNGAEPISAALCEEFLDRMQPTGLAHNAMYPVYGLAEGSLSVSFPPPGRAYRVARFDRHRLTVGEPAVMIDASTDGALELVSVGRPIPYCQVRIADDADQPLADEHVGHIHIRGDSVTSGYYEDPQTNAAIITADGWLKTGDLGLFHEGEIYITGRLKEILFVNGQNYYPHDLEHLLEGIPGAEIGKVAVAGVRAAHADTDDIVVFVVYRADAAQFLPLSLQIAHCISEHAGLEVTTVVPVQRIPKTTSGKIQRHLLESEYLAGQYDAQLQGLATLRAAQPAVLHSVTGTIERQLLSICEAALDGRSIDVEQSLFDIGASSLKLLAIHEQVDRVWPNLVDVTDIFEHSSIAALARFIETKQSGNT